MAMTNLVRDAKQIVCILPKGKAATVVEGLAVDFSLYNATVNHARGVGRFSPLRMRGIGEQQEKDILSVTVEAERADEIFEYLFFKAEMDQPHGGILYIESAPLTTMMEMPVIEQEEDA